MARRDGRCTRAGWYSFDRLDNGGEGSSTRIVPELQSIAVGTVFPALPGIRDGFTVLAFEPQRSLVLGWLGSDGAPAVTWAFVLEERASATRLVVRVRAREAYRFHRFPLWLSKRIIQVVHFVMQRRQLTGIARRVEASRGSSRQSKDQVL